jgi:uncharacterized protein (TIGR02246 family)
MNCVKSNFPVYNFVLISVIITFLSAGCDNDSDIQKDINEIEQISNNRAEAFRLGDASGISQYFTSDGIIMPPETPFKSGREAIEKYYNEIFMNYDRELNSYYEEVIISGDMAVGRGVAEVKLISLKDGEISFSSSKYINILERQNDGTWLTTHDIWNSDQ